MTPPDLFEPSRYAAVRQPLLDAQTLPPWCYTSPEFYAREIERIFLKCWQFVGREDEIAAAGDFLTFDGPGGPVVIVRGDDGVARAFYNACRHRGTPLVRDVGHANPLVCPYHSWVYACDGRLKRAPGMQDANDFELQAHGLLPVRMETWAGFMFICYAEDGPSLQTFLGDFAEFFSAYKPEDLVCVRRVRYEVESNWKLLIENALEAYHTGTVHAATLGRQSSKPVDAAGNWDALYVYVGSTESIAVLPGTAAPFPQIAGLSGDQLEGTFFTDIYPCTQFAFTQDCMWWQAVRPMGVDRSELILGSCFPRATASLQNFDDAVQAYYRRWDEATPEDNEIAESQQRGQQVTSRPAGRFSSEEFVVHKLANWVLDKVLD